MTTLRQVLEVFEDSPTPISIQPVARQLHMDSVILEDMILFWVRKGELREASFGKGCSSCGNAGGCPFVIPLSPHYERVRPNASDEQPICLYHPT